MKKVAALFFGCLLLFFTACSGGNSEAKEASADSVPAEETEAAADAVPLYADPFEISGEITIDIRMAAEAPELKNAEDVGWMIMSQTSRSLVPDMIAADNYIGNWALVLRGLEGEGDFIELVEGAQRTLLYQCGSIYPHIASVCYNASGVQWIEYNETHWRMRQIRPNGQAVGLLRESKTSAKGVSIAVSWEDSLMILYDTADGAALLRAWNGEKNRWREAMENVRTIQKEPPQSVGDWATWIELTSKGWAAVSRNFVTEEKRVFILSDDSKPTAATFDGQLLLLFTNNSLYAYDDEQGTISLISHDVSDYQHVPQSGAIFSVTNNKYSAMRFEFGKPDAEGNSGENKLFPLVRIRDGSVIQKVFYHGGDIDTAIFLAKYEGTYDQVTVTMMPSR